MAFQIKRNDLRPRYRIQLTETDPNNVKKMRPVDLTDATHAYFIMKGGGAGPPIINREPMAFIDRPTGIVEYAWIPGDTAGIGNFNIEIEVDWDGEPQTFPSTGFFTASIANDLG